MSDIAAKNQFAIIVNIKIKSGTAAQFMPLILDNAEASLRDEPACRQFQVAQAETDSDHFILFEVYDNAAAFDWHVRQAHSIRYNEAAGDLMVERTVQRCKMIGR